MAHLVMGLTIAIRRNFRCRRYTNAAVDPVQHSKILHTNDPPSSSSNSAAKACGKKQCEKRDTSEQQLSKVTRAFDDSVVLEVFSVFELPYRPASKKKKIGLWLSVLMCGHHDSILFLSYHRGLSVVPASEFILFRQISRRLDHLTLIILPTGRY